MKSRNRPTAAKLTTVSTQKYYPRALLEIYLGSPWRANHFSEGNMPLILCNRPRALGSEPDGVKRGSRGNE